MLHLQREGNTVNLKAWLHSLAAAAISAFATSVTAAIVDPSNFNFTLAGFERLAAVGGLSAIVAVLALLKQSPSGQIKSYRKFLRRIGCIWWCSPFWSDSSSKQVTLL